MAEARFATSANKADITEDVEITSAHQHQILNYYFFNQSSTYLNKKRSIFYYFNAHFRAVTTSSLVVAGCLYRKPLFVRNLYEHLDAIVEKLHIREDVAEYLKYPLAAVIIGVPCYVLIRLLRRIGLRSLLSYKGWLCEPPKTMSRTTLVWITMVKFFTSPYLQRRTYSNQSVLPRLPVPSLDHTIHELLNSLVPLYGENSLEITEFRELAESFRCSIAPHLQKLLILKSWIKSNYVTDWWEKYVYFSTRDAVVINSNYYVLSQNNHIPTKIPAARAAANLYLILMKKQEIEARQLQPVLLRNAIPLCMMQYKKIFCTTRIPKVECDKQISYDADYSSHIAVQSNGVWYVMKVFAKNGNILKPDTLERQLQFIIDDSKTDHSQNLHNVAALTGWTRDDWAKTRKLYFKSGLNQNSLELIESSILVINFVSESPNSLTARGQMALHGRGSDFWADKSINFLVYDNGIIDMNVEHSWADSPVIAHILCDVNAKETLMRDDIYSQDGHTKISEKLENVKKPRRLKWDIGPELTQHIDTAFQFCVKNIDNIDLEVRDHKDYGKGIVKCFKVSPDGYLQLAIQLAYYRLHEKFALTYESSTTRLYLHGRTETVRSLTQESCDFILAMQGGEAVDKALKIRLLRRACEKHVLTYRGAMAGAGVDRHLFALYVLSKGLRLDSPFLSKALSLPWTLSTSQCPLMPCGIDFDQPECRDLAPCGGGFGPVTDDGYGVSYLIVGDFRFIFHISSKRSSTDTDSKMMMDGLFQSLADMKALFDG